MILQEADFKLKVPVFNSIGWTLLEASVEQAEEDILKPLLGRTEYDNLVTASGSLPYTGNTLALYNKLKAPLAQMAAYLATDDLDVNVTSFGFTVKKTEDESPASQMRVAKFKMSQLRKAMSGFDRLLTWLEEEKATYTDWANGNGYTELKQGFLNTTAEFQDVVEINSSRYLFMRLRPHRRKVESTELKNVLSSDLYDEIKAEIVAGSISADNTALLPMIRDGVANRSIAKGFLALNLEVSEMGYLVSGMQESSTMNMKKPAKDTHADSLIRNYNTEADASFQALETYLNTNATASKYAAYFNSDVYEAPLETNEGNPPYINDADSAGFVF